MAHSYGKRNKAFFAKNNQVMLSPSYSRFLTWALVIGSAALCADISAASLDAYFTNSPGSIEIEKNIRGSRSDLTSAQAKDIASALRQPVEKKPAPPKKKRKSRIIGDKSSTARSERQTKDTQKEDKRDISKAVLQGTLISPSSRAAILELAPGVVEIVAEGEDIGKYTLTEVGSAWARFENDEEELLFVADSLSLSEGQDDKSSGPIVKKRPKAEENEEAAEQDKEDDKEDNSDDGQPRVSMADVRQALDNSAEMAKQLRVVPQEKDGQPYGTRVDFRDANNLLARMGVKDRDIMLSINGIPTRSAEEMYRGYMTLRNANSFEFVVERDGKEETIRYELDK